jgi:hypothetical protein
LSHLPSVEDKAVPAVGLQNARAQHFDDKLVGNKIARVHAALSLKARGRGGLDLLADHIAGANDRDAQLFADMLGLRAFARAGRAQ